jgi:extracellular matrix regulatory protein A
MRSHMVNIGFGNMVMADRVVSIVTPLSSPIKRLKDEARDANRLVDATHGRKTRSVIVLDSQHIVLSAIQVETLCQRLDALKNSEPDDVHRHV